jgi:hypothetical protein
MESAFRALWRLGGSSDPSNPPDVKIRRGGREASAQMHYLFRPIMGLLAFGYRRVQTSAKLLWKAASEM